MEAKVVVNKVDVEKHGIEETLFQLAKIIRSEKDSWILIPANNLKVLTDILEEKHISYGIESDKDVFRASM